MPKSLVTSHTWWYGSFGNQRKCIKRLHRNQTRKQCYSRYYFLIKLAARTIVQNFKKHKEPPTCRSMSMRHECVVVFTTAQNILFSTLEPRPGRAQTSAKMHHITALTPFTPCSFWLQEAAEGITPYIRPVKSHSSYLCFLRSTVSTATLFLQSRTTAWAPSLARLKQQNSEFLNITVQHVSRKQNALWSSPFDPIKLR